MSITESIRPVKPEEGLVIKDAGYSIIPFQLLDKGVY